MKLGKRRILLVGFLIPMLVLVSGAGYYFYQQNHAERALATVLADLDRNAPGWRLADLEKKRPVPPPEQDSAKLILKLHAKMPNNWGLADRDETWRELPPGEPLTEKQADVLQAKLRKVHELLPEM